MEFRIQMKARKGHCNALQLIFATWNRSSCASLSRL